MSESRVTEAAPAPGPASVSPAEPPAGTVCPACGNVRGEPDPSRFACPDCWEALPVVSPADTIRRTVGDMRHTHGLLNSMDPECSPMQRCLRCELENGLAALLAVGERDRRQIARLTEALERIASGELWTGDAADLARAVLAGEEDAGNG